MLARVVTLAVLLVVALVGSLQLTQSDIGTGADRPGAGERECRCPKVVAEAVRGKKAFFPDIVRLTDGRLLVAYREGVRHIGQDGRIMLTDSRDGGRTWSAPRVAVDTRYDDRDPKLTVTRHGLLMSYFSIDWAESGPSTVLGSYMVRSPDLGGHWGIPIAIDSAMSGLMAGPGPDAQTTYHLGWNAIHSSILELPNGDLLAPLYGTTPDDPWQRASVVRSVDGGRTWQPRSEIILAAAPGVHFQEPVISRLSDGRLLALIRSSDQRAYVARSTDNGHTWTSAAPTGLRAASHHLLPLLDGRLLVTYGDLSGNYGPRRVTVGKVLTDTEASWRDGNGVLLYDSRTDDQANPSSVEVRRGKFLTLSYDTAHGRIVGVFSYEKDYLRRGGELAPPPRAATAGGQP